MNMTKEELIELSDLNREDNVKYISSEAQGIAIALNNDMYAPTLCKLERAYICGRRKSENHIAELEKQNKKLLEQIEKAKELLKDWLQIAHKNHARCYGFVKDTEQFLKQGVLKMTDEELRKEATATIEWECTPMIDRPTFINGYLAGAEPREKRIEELEEICQDLSNKFDYQVRQVMKLEEENAKLKEHHKHFCDALTDTHRDIRRQLIKAREIILKLYNAGRDVLMCRTEEKAYDNLSDAVNDRSIEKFLQEVSK